MPAFNIKGVLLKELNSRNSQTLSVNDVGFGVPYSITNKRGKIIASASATGTVPNAGQAVVEYGVLDLDTVFGVIGRTVQVNLGSSVHAILPSIRRYTGLDIQTTDVENTAFSWNSDNTALVTVTATSTSQTWVGTTRLTLNLKPQNINALYAQLAVDLSAVPVITARDLWLAENKRNGVYVPFDVLTIGTPVAVNGNGYNTQVTASAKAGSGYEGVVEFRYTRRTIAQVFGSQVNVFEDVVTTRDLVPYLVGLKGNIITVDDIKDTEVIYTDPPSTNTVSAAEGSWTYAGDSAIMIRRRSDYVQKITLNFTNNNLAYTQDMLRQAIVAVDNGSPFADITLNIGKNVILVGADAANPTLILDNYGGITQADWYINNQGSIYGRGGNGGNGASPPGKAGGDAIRVMQDNAKVIINNQGRITGGGGGGGGYTASGRAGRGGGGAPLGVSGDGAAGTANLYNYTNGTTGSEYPIQVDGGRGAPPSLMGGDAIQTLTSSGAVSTVAKGGAGGLAVSGKTGKVTWTARGFILPLPTDFPQPTLPITAQYTGLPFAVYLDPADSSKSALYFGLTNITETRGDFLLNDLGLPSGIPTNASSVTMFVILLDNKWLIVPIQPRLSFVSFNSLYAAGLVYGDDTIGASPPQGILPTLQNRRFISGGEQYRLRLFQGATVDPVPTNTLGDEVALGVNSEWDRIMYLLQADAVSVNQPGAKWTTYTGGTLLTTSGANGSLNWTKERHDQTPGQAMRVVRGGGVTRLTPALNTAASTTAGYRFVLDWEGHSNESEYTRFLSWLASPAANIDTQLAYADMNTGPYWADNQWKSKGKPSIYNKLIAVNCTPGNNVMYGSPYRSTFNDTANWGNVFNHCMPSFNEWSASRLNGGRVALIYLSTSPKAAYTALSRNLMASSSGQASESQQWSLSVYQFVYYDRRVNKMMTLNPSVGNTPTEFLFWEGDKIPLNSVITQTTLGVLPEGTNDVNFLSQVARISGNPLATSEVVFSQPVAVNTAMGNTKITITPVAAGRYTAAVDVYFTRGASMLAIPDQYRFADATAFSGTQLAFLLKYLPDLLLKYFRSVVATDFQTTMTVAAGSLDTITLSLDWNKYRYNTPTTVTVNPKRDNWEGADLIMGFDTDDYVQDGFTDKAGNTIVGTDKYYGGTSRYPAKSTIPMVFGQGLALNAAAVKTTNKLPAETFSGAWTIDMWVNFQGGTLTASQILPFMPLYATTDPLYQDPNNSLRVGASDATTTAMAVWNNNASPKLLAGSNAALRTPGWHHVAVTYDGSFVRWFVDGVLIITNGAYAVVGANWALCTYGNPVNGIYPVIERYRMRKGVKFANAGFSANDIYAG